MNLDPNERGGTRDKYKIDVPPNSLSIKANFQIEKVPQNSQESLPQAEFRLNDLDEQLTSVLDEKKLPYLLTVVMGPKGFQGSEYVDYINNTADTKYRWCHVYVQVSVYPVNLFLQKTLATKAKGDWHLGSFQHSFKELDTITENYQDLDLSDIEKVLIAEGKNPSQQFEFLGTKIPTQILGKVGFVLLLAVELYLYLHLRVFRSRLSINDPAWDTAWIALYRDRASRWTVILSVCLPPIIIIMIIGRANFLKESALFITYSLLILVLSALLSAAIVRILFNIWKIDSSQLVGTEVSR